MEMAEAKENKIKYTNIFQPSACVSFFNILLAKQVTVGGEVHASHGGEGGESVSFSYQKSSLCKILDWTQSKCQDNHCSPFES